MKSKLLLAVAACSLGFAVQSCTDFEEGATIGAVAGGVIGANLDDGHGHGHYHHRRDSRHCYYDVSLSNVSYVETLNAGTPAPKAQSEYESVAQKYNIPMETSRMIVDSIHAAQNHDYSQLANWGVTESDVANFYNNKALSDEAVFNVSQKIGFDMDETRELLGDMAADVQSAKLAQAQQ